MQISYLILTWTQSPLMQLPRLRCAYCFDDSVYAEASGYDRSGGDVWYNISNKRVKKYFLRYLRPLCIFGYGNMCFKDGKAVESDSMLWTRWIEDVGDAWMFPKIGSSLTAEQLLQVHALVVEFNYPFDSQLVPGGHPWSQVWLLIGCNPWEELFSSGSSYGAWITTPTNYWHCRAKWCFVWCSYAHCTEGIEW